MRGARNVMSVCLCQLFASQLQRAAENSRPQVSAQQLSASAAGARGRSTTPGARARTYGTASVPGMPRPPLTGWARPRAAGHPTTSAWRAFGTRCRSAWQPVWIRSVGRAECLYCCTDRISCQPVCRNSQGHSERQWSAREARTEQSFMNHVCNTPEAPPPPGTGQRSPVPGL